LAAVFDIGAVDVIDYMIGTAEMVVGVAAIGLDIADTVVVL